MDHFRLLHKYNLTTCLILDKMSSAKLELFFFLYNLKRNRANFKYLHYVQAKAGAGSATLSMVGHIYFFKICSSACLVRGKKFNSRFQLELIETICWHLYV